MSPKTRQAISLVSRVVSRLLSVVLRLLIRIYQYGISPWLGHRCRFYPTCSHYGLQAIEKHGPFIGVWLTARRLLACHPWSSRMGHDPVPEHWPVRFVCVPCGTQASADAEHEPEFEPSVAGGIKGAVAQKHST